MVSFISGKIFKKNLSAIFLKGKQVYVECCDPCPYHSPSSREIEARGLQFGGSLGYTVSSGPTWVMK
jgi:hypothetical protein